MIEVNGYRFSRVVRGDELPNRSAQRSAHDMRLIDPKRVEQSRPIVRHILQHVRDAWLFPLRHLGHFVAQEGSVLSKVNVCTEDALKV